MEIRNLAKVNETGLVLFYLFLASILVRFLPKNLFWSGSESLDEVLEDI